MVDANDDKPVERKVGINRLEYVFALFGLAAVYIVLANVALENPVDPSEGSLVILIPLAIVQIIITGMRFKNIGYSSALAILVLVPLVNVVILLQCLMYPSGYSQTKQFDLPAKISGAIVVIVLPYVLYVLFLK